MAKFFLLIVDCCCFLIIIRFETANRKSWVLQKLLLQSTIDAMIRKSKVETQIVNRQFFRKLNINNQPNNTKAQTGQT